MYKLKFTSRFKKDYRLMQKRGLPMEKLKAVVEKLQKGEPLDVSHRDHALTGNFDGFRECHIMPDWLLIYLKDEKNITLTLTQTGSHSDLFKK